MFVFLDESDDELDEDEFKENLEEIQKEKMVNRLHIAHIASSRVYALIDSCNQWHSKEQPGPGAAIEMCIPHSKGKVIVHPNQRIAWARLF